eukprot:Clim_evm10s62 gene=Clim_evmTU10s62
MLASKGMRGTRISVRSGLYSQQRWLHGVNPDNDGGVTHPRVNMSKEKRSLRRKRYEEHKYMSKEERLAKFRDMIQVDAGIRHILPNSVRRSLKAEHAPSLSGMSVEKIYRDVVDHKLAEEGSGKGFMNATGNEQRADLRGIFAKNSPRANLLRLTRDELSRNPILGTQGATELWNRIYHEGILHLQHLGSGGGESERPALTARGSTDSTGEDSFQHNGAMTPEKEQRKSQLGSNRPRHGRGGPQIRLSRQRLQALSQQYITDVGDIIAQEQSQEDFTVKWVLKTPTGGRIETVYIPDPVSKIDEWEHNRKFMPSNKKKRPLTEQQRLSIAGQLENQDNDDEMEDDHGKDLDIDINTSDDDESVETQLQVLTQLSNNCGDGVIRSPFGEISLPGVKSGTVCVSSQVGCNVGCRFCRTGTMSNKELRNLTAEEIVAQVWHVKNQVGDFARNREAKELTALRKQRRRSRYYREEITADKALDDYDDKEAIAPDTKTSPQQLVRKVVFMGMGEPLLNYRSVKSAIDIISDSAGLKIGQEKIIVSTSGVVPNIVRLATDTKVQLAVSLHAPIDRLRSGLVPLNKQYSITDLMKACQVFSNIRGLTPSKPIMFEYVMIDGINDSPDLARELAVLVRNIPHVINLIPFNPWTGSAMKPSSPHRIAEFVRVLRRHMEGGPSRVTVRRTMGQDISAACGQLKVEQDSDMYHQNRLVPLKARHATNPKHLGQMPERIFLPKEN